MTRLNEAKPRETGIANIGKFVDFASKPVEWLGYAVREERPNQANLFAAMGAVQWIRKYIPNGEADEPTLRAHFEKMVGLAGKRGLDDVTKDKVFKKMTSYDKTSAGVNRLTRKGYEGWGSSDGQNYSETYEEVAMINFRTLYQRFLIAAANALGDSSLKDFATSYDYDDHTLEEIEAYVSEYERVKKPSDFELSDEEIPSYEELIKYAPGFRNVSFEVNAFDQHETELEAVDTSAISINEKEWDKMFNYYKKNSKINFNAITDKQKCLSRYVIAELLGWSDAAIDAEHKLRDSFGMTHTECEAYARAYAKSGKIPDKYKDEIKMLKDEGIGAAGNHGRTGCLPDSLLRVLDKNSIPYKVENANGVIHRGNSYRNGCEWEVSYYIYLWPKTLNVKVGFTNHTNEGGGTYGYSISCDGGDAYRGPLKDCIAALERTVEQYKKEESTNKTYEKILQEGSLVIPRKVAAMASSGKANINNDSYANLLLQRARTEKDPLKRAIALERYDNYIASKKINESKNEVTDNFEDYVLALSDMPGTEQGPKAIKESTDDGVMKLYDVASDTIEAALDRGFSKKEVKMAIYRGLENSGFEFPIDTFSLSEQPQPLQDITDKLPLVVDEYVELTARDIKECILAVANNFGINIDLTEVPREPDDSYYYR